MIFSSFLITLYRRGVNIPYVGYFIKSMNNIRIRYRFKKLNEKFLIHADNMLQILAQIYEKDHLEFFLFWGTFLGAYREHNFIPHDLDMDIAVWDEDSLYKIKECLTASGFAFLGKYFFPDHGVEEMKFDYHGVHLDVFKINKSETEFSSMIFTDIVSCPNSTQLCSCTEIFFPKFQLQEITFRGRKFLAPTNEKEVLSAIYGDDFMIPNAKHKSCSRCTHQIIYTFYEKPAFFMEEEEGLMNELNESPRDSSDY